MSADQLPSAPAHPQTTVDAEEYRQLRRDLIRYLEWEGSADPEDMADEAIAISLRRLAGGVDASEAGLRGYAFGVVKNLIRDGWKKQKKRRREVHLDPADLEQAASMVGHHDQIAARLILEKVLGQLSPADRRLLLRYCSEDNHRKHSEDLGVEPGNLRVMVHRIRNDVRKMMVMMKLRADGPAPSPVVRAPMAAD